MEPSGQLHTLNI